MPCLSLLLIINNQSEARASDGQLHTFTTRHGQDDARKGSSNRPVGQPKEGSKTPIWQARNHSNKQPQRIFQHLASTIALRAYAFLSRMCFLLFQDIREFLWKGQARSPGGQNDDGRGSRVAERKRRNRQDMKRRDAKRTHNKRFVCRW